MAFKRKLQKYFKREHLQGYGGRAGREQLDCSCMDPASTRQPLASVRVCEIVQHIKLNLKECFNNYITKLFFAAKRVVLSREKNISKYAHLQKCSYTPVLWKPVTKQVHSMSKETHHLVIHYLPAHQFNTLKRTPQIIKHNCIRHILGHCTPINTKIFYVTLMSVHLEQSLCTAGN